jgi:hypothetical protein
MKLITRKMLAKEAAEKWKDAYYSEEIGWEYRFFKVYERLVALGEDPDPDDVDNAIGNNSWTKTACSECDEVEGVLRLRIGGEPDYDSNMVYLCAECLEKAYNIGKKSKFMIDK